MPKYVYRCKSCEETLEITHSILEKLRSCERCGTEDSLVRIPSHFFYTDNINVGADKPGGVVKKTIKEAAEELKEQKDSLRGQELEFKE